MVNETVLDRRRALALAAALALGTAGELAGWETGTAAKGNTKRKKGKKKKSSGKKVVKYAQKYKGSRYVWGGESPKGFDCSGFTWYVYKNAAGVDIGRVVKDQYKRGKKVGRGSWKPGDIVFFKNTGEKGLSHCGIFIKKNKFIHAENEKTGVVISTLSSGYYKDHYAGARRIV
jgi:cell wall-associated NlpC family hydrolase